MEEIKMTYRVEKATSEVYTIRFDDHRAWFIQATIMEDRGYLALSTSHGDWQYRWGSPGMPFKQFLTTLDNSYLMGKLGCRNFFNDEETLKQIAAKEATTGTPATPGTPATTNKKITKQMLEVLLTAGFISKFRSRYYLSSSTDVNPYFMAGDFNFDITSNE